MIPAIVLAAGKSTRMGRPKAKLPLERGDTFLTRIVRTFTDAGVDDVVIVVGAGAAAIVSEFSMSGLHARFVENPDFEKGQLSSLQTGLRAIDRPGVSAALVTLVDVPLVAASTVRAVLGRYRETGAPIVRPTRGERHGHPVLIARSLFDALRSADPAVGAKQVVRDHASQAGDVLVDDEGAFSDFDTPEEYARIAQP
jgi:molybdenum cofactor cytidylyltransferase